MSVEIIANLTKDLEQHKLAIKGLIAQCDAAKGMFNEGLNNTLQLRTNNIVLQNHNNELMQKVSELEKSLSDATARIDELTKTNATLD